MNCNCHFIAVFFAIALTIHMSAIPSFSDEAERKALQEKVNALEKRVNQLEHSSDQRFKAIEKIVLPAQKQASKLDIKAKEELNSIIELISNDQIALAREKLAEFLKTYGSTRSASSARKLNQEISMIGMDAPTDWGIAAWFQGEDEFDLKEQNTTLVLFWETWCGYCRREMPKIQKIYTDYKDKGLKVIGLTKVNRSATPETVIEFIKENSITYPIAMEDGSMTKYFKVQGIPAAALISNGKIVWRGNPARLPDQLLKKYLGN
jgi:thiol-disulfide isomerase/thioredoxin